jgi:hypothetical protein
VAGDEKSHGCLRWGCVESSVIESTVITATILTSFWIGESLPETSIRGQASAGFPSATSWCVIQRVNLNRKRFSAPTLRQTRSTSFAGSSVADRSGSPSPRFAAISASRPSGRPGNRPHHSGLLGLFSLITLWANDHSPSKRPWCGLRVGGRSPCRPSATLSPVSADSYGSREISKCRGRSSILQKSPLLPSTP